MSQTGTTHQTRFDLRRYRPLTVLRKEFIRHLSVYSFGVYEKSWCEGQIPNGVYHPCQRDMLGLWEGVGWSALRSSEEREIPGE